MSAEDLGTLYVSYDLDAEFSAKEDQIVEHLKRQGFNQTGSGTGFGRRDLDFSTDLPVSQSTPGRIKHELIKLIGDETVEVFSPDKDPTGR